MKNQKTKAPVIEDKAEPEVIPPPPPEVEAQLRAEQVKPDQEPAKEPEVLPPAGKKPEATTELPKKVPVALDSRGVPMPTDLDGAYRMVSVLFKGKAFPNWVKTAEQAFAVAQFLRALGLDVMTGIQHVCEVNGRLSLWGEGPLAAVRASGKMKNWREWYIDKDYNEINVKNKNLHVPIFAAVCESTRVDTGETKQSWFSNEDEKTANKGLDAVWRGYKRIMYKRKARAEHVKDLYGDVVLGAGIAEYDDESAPDMPVEQPKNLAAQMNEKLQIGGPVEQEVQTQ